jgi:superfamily II DNA or RNA helicase
MEHIAIPDSWELDCDVAGNRVRQLRRAAYVGDATAFKLAIGRHEGYRLEAGDRSIAVVGKPLANLPEGEVLLCATKGTTVLPAPDAEPTTQRWLRPMPATALTAAELAERAEDVRTSWVNHFVLRTETAERDGLRPPQVGALHAVLAHWTMSDDASTIVMPTGTGKTETMLSLIVSERLANILVIVPTVPLRDQTLQKFAALGVLPALGIILPGARFPLVGVMEHGIADATAAEAFLRSCNVAVATMGAINECSAEARLALAQTTGYLFIDEAHHIPAATWSAFRAHFPNSRVIQFTATPFRNDGKRVDGRVIYDYPLGRAQANEMFQKIRFTAIAAFTQETADREIAKKAKEQLDRDRAEGLDHLVMARARSIHRAEELLALYQAIAPEHAPVLIHSEQSATQRRQAIRSLQRRTSRIVVCVNMLGEGFDLPELKIAALHDPHKSLAITLQFIGRFARTKKGKIGVATAIGNVVDQRVEASLKKLYADDSDWNLILRDLSEHATQKEVRRSEFLKRFTPPLDVMPLQNVYPRMSTVAYEVGTATWDAERLRQALTRDDRSTITINDGDHVALFVQRNDTAIRWGDTQELINTAWELYVVYWCDEYSLLFINGSDTGELYETLAAEVAGEDLGLVHGNVIFRTLSGIHQLILNTLGLTHSLSHAIRFTMHSGSDVKEGLSEAQTLNAVKVNLFGHGYEEGETASLGVSRKGRIWSHLVAYDLEDWLTWCRRIGVKLRDETITDATLLGNVVVPVALDARPDAVPLTIEWSDELFDRPEELTVFKAHGQDVPFYDVGISLDGHASTGAIGFTVTLAEASFHYTVAFGQGTMSCKATGDEVEIQYGRRCFPLSEWLTKRSPIIRFHDNSFVAYGELFRIDTSHHAPFARERIETWDWSGVDFGKESQTAAKRPDSIQFRVLQELLGQVPAYGIVFDDDGTHEAADIVAFRDDDEFLYVDLYHCKYAHSAEAGARVADLYEVCGQAQRSIQWRHDVEKLLRHLRYRDARRVQLTTVSRFERGDQSALTILMKRTRFLRPKFRIHIVQPGLSKASATTGQLDLLSATEAYLLDTFGVPLSVIASG